MSEIIELVLIVPIVLYLIIFSIVQFPMEFYRMYYVSSAYLEMHADENHIYKVKVLNSQTSLEVNPQRLLELVHTANDTYQELTERVESDGYINEDS